MTITWKPSKAKGKRRLENDRIRRLVWPAVLRRAGYACEGCGLPNVTLQFAHLFGRPSTGAGLGAWANSEHLTAALCTIHDGEVGCHEKVDRHLDPDLARTLRREALHRLFSAYGPPVVTPADIRIFLGTLDEARQLVAEIESYGYTYDPLTQRPRRSGE